MPIEWVRVENEVVDKAKTGVSVGTTTTVVLGPENLLRYKVKSFTLQVTAATALNTAKVQATRVEVKPSADGNPGTPNPYVPSTLDTDWEDVDTTTFASLAQGKPKTLNVVNDARKWWRIVATVASGSTTLNAYATGQSV